MFVFVQFMYIDMHVCVCVSRCNVEASGQWEIFFLNHSLPYFFEKQSHTDSEAHELVKLASQQALGILLTSSSWRWDCRHCRHKTTLFWVSSGDPRPTLVWQHITTNSSLQHFYLTFTGVGEGFTFIPTQEINFMKFF